VMLKVGDRPAAPVPRGSLPLADRWILSRTQATLRDVDRALEEYRFDHAADRLYHFVWHEFCDWYIEFAKTELAEGAPEEARASAAAVLVEVLGTSLRLLHPLMPYVSEELWHKLRDDGSYLATTAWPAADDGLVDPAAEAGIELLQELVVKVRNLRAETNIDSRKPIEVRLRTEDPAVRGLLEREAALVSTLVRASALHIVEEQDEQVVAARGVARGIEIVLPLAGVLDLGAERQRLERERSKLEGELATRVRKLESPSFVDKAPPEIVARERELRDELLRRRERLERHLELLADRRDG